MSQANQTPPEIHEGKTDRTELYRLINWLRKQVGSFSSAAPFWVSQATAGLTGAVDMGALGTGVIQQVVTAGLSVPQARFLTATQIVYGGPAGLIAQDAGFTWTGSALSIGGTITTTSLTTGLVAATAGLLTMATASSVTALIDWYPLVSRATNAPANAVNLGALTTGVLQHTVGAGISTPQAVTVPEHAVLFGDPSGLLDYDVTAFYYDKAAVSLGVGDVPSIDTIVSAIKSVDGPATIFVANTSGGSNATADLVVQAVSAVRGVPPYLGLGAFGAGYVGDPLARPYWVAGGTVIGYAGNELLNIDLQNPTPGSGGDPDLVISVRSLTGDQEDAFRVAYDGTLSGKLSLSAGGVMWAAPTTGDFGLVNISTGLSFDTVTGTLTATGSGGTVTSVTATPPMYSSGGTTPNITLGYDAVTLIMDGFGNLSRSALTGVIDVPAASNTATFSAIAARSVLANATGASASPGAFPAPNSGDVLWRNGAGLTWSAIPVSSVTGAVPDTRTIGTTAPLTGGGDLSTNRTFALNTDATFGVLAGQLTMIPFTGSGAGHLKGAVPDPGAVAGTTRFLREDATWVVPTAGFQPTITWPTAGQVLYSSGTSTDPIGVAGLVVDTATQQLRVVGTSASQAWFNLLSGGDFERVMAFWTSNTFTLLSQAGGTGTVRPILVDAGVSSTTIQGSTSYVLGTASVVIQGPQTVTVSATSSEPYISVVGVASGSDAGVLFVPTVTIASAASATLDAFTFNNDTVTITGATHITTATGFNQTVFRAPAYTSGSALTVDAAATVYMAGPPAATGSLTIANAYTLWIDSGEFRLDGATAPSGAGTPVFSTTPGSPTQAVWIPIISNGTPYMVPAWFRT